jgi:histidyl-tRNA synthetase
VKTIRSLLREYLSEKSEGLSDESKKRMDTNILRIFDSKVESDQTIMEDAPLLLEHLDNESLEKFERVKEILLAAKVPFEIEPRLVRGLDYYTHTTFEIISRNIGSQSALCGGGRYDLLAQQIGDRSVPGVGFAAGIERLLMACDNENSLQLEPESIDAYIVRLDKELNKEAYDFSLKLRRAGFTVELDYLTRSVKAQMREANKLNARKTIFIGGEEFEKNEIVIKDMNSSEQQNISLNEFDKIVNQIKG